MKLCNPNRVLLTPLKPRPTPQYISDKHVVLLSNIVNNK
jgi:hypothetical protein